MNELLNWAGAVIHSLAIWMDSIIPSVLLTTRGACHLLIALVVGSYQNTMGHHRRVIGFMAAVFVGANLAEAYRILVNFASFSAVVQPPLTLVMICVLFFVLHARGNVARMLPRRFDELLR